MARCAGDLIYINCLTFRSSVFFANQKLMSYAKHNRLKKTDQVCFLSSQLRLKLQNVCLISSKSISNGRSTLSCMPPRVIKNTIRFLKTRVEWMCNLVSQEVYWTVQTSRHHQTKHWASFVVFPKRKRGVIPMSSWSYRLRQLSPHVRACLLFYRLNRTTFVQWNS